MLIPLLSYTSPHLITFPVIQFQFLEIPVVAFVPLFLTSTAIPFAKKAFFSSSCHRFRVELCKVETSSLSMQMKEGMSPLYPYRYCSFYVVSHRQPRSASLLHFSFLLNDSCREHCFLLLSRLSLATVVASLALQHSSWSWSQYVGSLTGKCIGPRHKTLVAVFMTSASHLRSACQFRPFFFSFKRLEW